VGQSAGNYSDNNILRDCTLDILYIWR